MYAFLYLQDSRQNNVSENHKQKTNSGTEVMIAIRGESALSDRFFAMMMMKLVCTNNTKYFQCKLHK